MEPTKAPGAEQTDEAIEAWLRENVKVGSEVAVRHTQGGMYQYELGRVIRLGRGRFHVEIRQRDGTFVNTGASFYYSGRNCWHPKGQTSLVMPTPAVREAIEISERKGYIGEGPWTVGR